MNNPLNDCFNPHTKEHIDMANPAPWMGRAGISPPVYNAQTQGCFWLNDDWEVVEAESDPGPVPQSLTWRQANLALIDAGKLSVVKAFIDSITDPTEKAKAEVEYQSPTYLRDSAFLNFAWEQLGGTQVELDDLFRLAGTK